MALSERQQILIHGLAALDPPVDYHVAAAGYGPGPAGEASVVYTAPAGRAREVFRASAAAGGWPEQLTSGLGSCTCPVLSPDGRRVAFIRRRAVWVLDLEGGALGRVTRDDAGKRSLRWSPDGTRLAFVSRRGGWDQLWVAETGASGRPAQAPRNLTPWPREHSDPAWSPDGRWVAYTALGDDLETQGIYRVAAAGGAQEPLTVDQGVLQGSPAWSPDGNRLACLSERDGWFHLYALGPFDSVHPTVRQLTSGEVEDGCPTFDGIISFRGCLWSPDGSRIAFTRSVEGSCQIWIVPSAGGEERPLTYRPGAYRLIGWAWRGADILAVAETWDRSAELVRIAPDGTERRLTAFFPRALAGSAAPARRPEPAPERIALRGRRGHTIGGWLHRPPGPPGPPGPGGAERGAALVWPHEGPNEQSTGGWNPLVFLLVQEGYTVLRPDFRGSTGYGRVFRRANYRSWGRADLEDVLDAAEWLRHLDGIDPSRLGIGGTSYGGYMALRALTESPETFAVGIDLYGDSELAESFRHGDRMGRLDIQRQMGRPDENPEAYRLGSPLYRADRIRSPLLVLHGRDDPKVVPQMSELMIEALRIEGKLFESAFYEGEGHGFRDPCNREDAMRRILEFLRRYL